MFSLGKKNISPSRDDKSWILISELAGRNMLAGGFPLFANPMFTNLGYPGAASLLGGIVSDISYTETIFSSILGSLAD